MSILLDISIQLNGINLALYCLQIKSKIDKIDEMEKILAVMKEQKEKAEKNEFSFNETNQLPSTYKVPFLDYFECKNVPTKLTFDFSHESKQKIFNFFLTFGLLN